MIRPYFIFPLLAQGLKGWTFSQPVVVFNQRRERIKANLIPSLKGWRVAPGWVSEILSTA